MDRRELERLLHVIRDARAAGEPTAIATVVRVKGSAYRREGTHMIVRRNGTYECSLSGGCLDPAVAEAAARVITTHRPILVSYDLADDSVWGLGIGCSGAVDILIECFDEDEITGQWLTLLERGEPAVLVTPLSGVSGRVLVTQKDEVIGGLTSAAVQREAVARARARLQAPYPSSGVDSAGCAEVFCDVSLPPPELVIFGAGHDAVPVSQLAWSLGFDVTVVDARDAFLTHDRFPGAALTRAHAGEFKQFLRPRPGAFTLVMNHHLERDEESLRFCLKSGAAYIGVLGPRTRYERMLADLASQGYVPEKRQLERVHSPVGLAVGAETPHEVAVSILADMLAVRHGFHGGSLNGSRSSLHRPEDSRALASS